MKRKSGGFDRAAAPPQGRKAPPSTPLTVRKALSILDALATEREGIGLTSLANRLSLNKSTVYRLLSALRDYGLVEQISPNGRYRLGLKLIYLASQVLAGLEIREVAHSYLIALRDQTRESVRLGVIDRGDVVYVDYAEGPEKIRLHTYPGTRAPIHASSIGKAMLAFLPWDEVERLIAEHGLPRLTPNTICDLETLRTHLDQVRAQGYAVNDEESTLMVRSVGAPIFNAQGRPIAGIGVSGPAFRMTPERLQSIVPSLKDAAAKLSAQFGYVVQHGAPDAQEAERNGQPSSSGAATSA